jgi:hypothetical protein
MEKMNALHEKDGTHQKIAIKPAFVKKQKIPAPARNRRCREEKSYFSSFSQASAAPSRNCPP